MILFHKKPFTTNLYPSTYMDKHGTILDLEHAWMLDKVMERRI